MPIFKCHKCNYQTTRRQHINIHLLKKNPCKSEVIICKNVINMFLEEEKENEPEEEKELNELVELEEEHVNNVNNFTQPFQNIRWV